MRRIIGMVALICVLAAGYFGSVTAARADTDYEGIITRAYQDVLGRRPDPGGMRNFRSKMIDKEWSEEDVRNALRDSAEYKNHKTDLIIKRAYQDLLGRDPDRGGYEMYKKRIENEGWSERQVRASIRESQEYRNKH